MTIEQGHRYEMSGNTFANKDAIRGLGAAWDKDAKVWTLDLTDCSKARFQRELSDKLFRLGKNGVNFKKAS